MLLRNGGEPVAVKPKKMKKKKVAATPDGVGGESLEGNGEAGLPDVVKPKKKKKPKPPVETQEAA